MQVCDGLQKEPRREVERKKNISGVREEVDYTWRCSASKQKACLLSIRYRPSHGLMVLGKFDFMIYIHGI